MYQIDDVQRETDREARASVVYFTEESSVVMPSEFNDGWHHMETEYPQREDGLTGSLLELVHTKGYDLQATIAPYEKTWKDDDGVALQEKGYRVDLKGPGSQIEDFLVEACKAGYGIPERTEFSSVLHPITSTRGYQIAEKTTSNLSQITSKDTVKVDELEKGKWAFLKRESTYRFGDE
ncbi:MAG: hypothetical protein QGG50_06990 [Methanopyri archaeon]|nr:hypothetical protein [Methanopyri archaeon]